MREEQKTRRNLEETTMYTESQIREKLVGCNALETHVGTDEFYHANVQIDLGPCVESHPDVLEELAHAFVEAHLGVLEKSDTIVGVANGSAPFAKGITSVLKEYHGGDHVCVAGEKIPRNGFTFVKKACDRVGHASCFVLGDLDSSKEDLLSLMQAVKQFKGEITAVGVMVDTVGLSDEDVGNTPFCTLGEILVKTWLPWDCALCAAGEKVSEDVGSGKKFLKEYPYYEVPKGLWAKAKL